jgi:hypothetical protein
MSRKRQPSFHAFAIGCAAGLLLNSGQLLADAPSPPRPIVEGVNIVPAAGESPGCNRTHKGSGGNGEQVQPKDRFESYDDCIKEHFGSPEKVDLTQKGTMVQPQPPSQATQDSPGPVQNSPGPAQTETITPPKSEGTVKSKKVKKVKAIKHPRKNRHATKTKHVKTAKVIRKARKHA